MKASELYNFLHVGNRFNAEDIPYIKKMEYTHILNCTSNEVITGSDYYWFSSFRSYLELPATDNNNYDITQHFQQAIEFIEHARKNSGKLLIYCYNGVNCGPLIAAAYCMMSERIGPIEATRKMRAIRYCLSNERFLMDLLCCAGELGLLRLDADLVKK